MATTTLVFPVNPFATGETMAPAPQAARIDRKRSSVTGYHEEAGHASGDSGKGAMDDFFDAADQTVSVNDPMAESSSYLGTNINIYV
jgi:hypothetical protein